jgi:hypothetical protein
VTRFACSPPQFGPEVLVLVRFARLFRYLDCVYFDVGPAVLLADLSHPASNTPSDTDGVDVDPDPDPVFAEDGPAAVLTMA